MKQSFAETDSNMYPATMSHPLHSSYDSGSGDDMSLGPSQQRESSHNFIPRPSQIVTPTTSIDFDDLQLSGMNISMTSSQSSYSFDSEIAASNSNLEREQQTSPPRPESMIIGLPSSYPAAQNHPSKRVSHNSLQSSLYNLEDVDDAEEYQLQTMVAAAPRPSEAPIHPLLLRNSLSRAVTPPEAASGTTPKQRHSKHHRRRHPAGMTDMKGIEEAMMEEFDMGSIDIGGKLCL